MVQEAMTHIKGLQQQPGLFTYQLVEHEISGALHCSKLYTQFSRDSKHPIRDRRPHTNPIHGSSFGRIQISPIHSPMQGVGLMWGVFSLPTQFFPFLPGAQDESSSKQDP
eukprot:1158546-Pelagomonas_calceolata.AAC.11